MTLPAAVIPKANVLGKTDGLIKLIADTNDDQILGAHLFCAESHEITNTIKVMMDACLPYTALRDMIFTHPTMGEAFNDLPEIWFARKNAGWKSSRHFCLIVILFLKGGKWSYANLTRLSISSFSFGSGSEPMPPKGIWATKTKFPGTLNDFFTASSIPGS